jgi:FkbM family methyltransferase
MRHTIIETLFAGLRTALTERSTGPLFTDGRPVYIYGAGNVGKDVYRLLTSRGIMVAGFLDFKTKPGSIWMGVPVSEPNDPRLSASQREGAHVVIGIFNCFVEMPRLMTQLKELGYEHVTSFLDFHDEFAAELGDRFWLTARSYYCGKEQTIAAGYELWSDDTSRNLYASMLRFRFTKDYETVPPPTNEQYLAKDMPSWPIPIRLIDCGAFEGDTLKLLADSGLSLEAIAAFEPDPGNFSKLVQYVRDHMSNLPKEIFLFPCGAGAATTQVRFSSGQGIGSRVSATGDTVIQCASLDEALPVFRPNLIKMDIEGAEYDALWGARRLIAECRPALAICLYHSPQHLWQLPLLVRQFTEGGGKYYLRSHSLNGFELVFYWLPE